MDNNKEILYEIAIKMVKDKHNINEYPREKFDKFYYQTFRNNPKPDNYKILNKQVLKSIDEELLIKQPEETDETIDDKIKEYEKQRANINIITKGVIEPEIEIQHHHNDNQQSLDINKQTNNYKYINIDNNYHNGRSFIINTIKNSFNIINKYNNYNIYPAYLCIPSIIKNKTPYIILGITDGNNNITYTFIPEIINDVWDIWKPVNEKYNNISLENNWNINLYDYGNNYINFNGFYLDILEVLEDDKYFNCKIRKNHNFMIDDKIRIIFNNNVSHDYYINNIDEDVISINKNNIKLDQFINSRIFNFKNQISLIFKIFPK
uniref:Uncharacterized protein n=1 Tax=viral metagenome TaxID=1070528 RepID=A0A6C0CGZ0_9ZZZZ